MRRIKIGYGIVCAIVAFVAFSSGEYFGVSVPLMTKALFALAGFAIGFFAYGNYSGLGALAILVIAITYPFQVYVRHNGYTGSAKFGLVLLIAFSIAMLVPVALHWMQRHVRIV